MISENILSPNTKCNKHFWDIGGPEVWHLTRHNMSQVAGFEREVDAPISIRLMTVSHKLQLFK